MNPTNSPDTAPTSHPKGAEPIDVINDGRSIEILLHDGTTMTVKVRLVPVAEYPTLVARLDKETALVAFACGLTEAETDPLPPLAIMQLVDEIMNLNFDSVRLWMKHRVSVGRVALPHVGDVTELLMTAQKEIDQLSSQKQ